MLLDQFAAEWQTWHDERELSLAAPHGWLSVTGLHWLDGTVQRVPGAPGSWALEADAVRVRTDPGERISPTGEALLLTRNPEAGREDRELPDGRSARLDVNRNLAWLSDGSTLVELIRREKGYGARLRDANAPLLRGFRGVPAFEPDPGWVVRGRFTPHPEPRRHRVDTAQEGVFTDVETTGTVSFRLGGRDHRLHVTGAPERGLSAEFSDLTSGSLSPDWRSVFLGVPDAEGHVLIDFNRAIGMPSAFTSHAVCRAPVAGDFLPVEITAGERRPVQRLDGDKVSTPMLVLRIAERVEMDAMARWWREGGVETHVVDLAAGERPPPLLGYGALIVVGDEVDGAEPYGVPAAAADLIGDALAQRISIVGFGAETLLRERLIAEQIVGEGRGEDCPGLVRQERDADLTELSDLVWSTGISPDAAVARDPATWRSAISQFTSMAVAGMLH